MYHPQCELLMPHESLELDIGQSHLAAAVAAMPGELNFHLLHSLEAAVAAAAASSTGATSQPTVDYFFGGSAEQQATVVQYDQLVAPPHHQTVTMLRDYYGGHYPPAGAATEAYLRGPRTGSSSLVFGPADDESAYMVGPFDSSPTPRSGAGGRKRSRANAGFRGGGPANGVEKKEKQRRQRLTEKYNALMLLIPNRTKEDRATVISDAIEYIQELGRTVEELTLLVEKKRRRGELQGDVVDVAPSAVLLEAAESSEGEVAAATTAAAVVVPRQLIRSTYIQRRSKETFVDVRIVEDDVNIKLTKRRRDGCLAAASRALDDLRLDLVHLSGGKIGDCHIYMFNTKIHPGSPVFASAVASRLIEVVDEY
ncbi:transcription factor TIP2-like [Oryza brachyantha]|uniref:transcription factor TIP2-like n=1 Tax=Oryza brachyantha TaxID=4533 RepID=UPI000776896B|nr:transcription factor TIP2-like [Oryza brachyantha]XP_040385912.1 transcription factor TIP2-like [Oryza brachyantha]XP_040385913.1 transcription factor TIP2-like [Oryza brachyantha]